LTDASARHKSVYENVANESSMLPKHLNTLRASVQYICTSISAYKTAVLTCVTNALAPPPIALESCSRAQTDQPV